MNRKVFICLVSSLFSMPSFAALSKQDQNAVDQALQIYNSMNQKMINESMDIASVPSDRGFLSSTFKDTTTSPKAILKDDKIFVEGAKYPLKIVDLKTGKFTLNGYALDFQSPISAEKQITKIQKIIDGSVHSKFDFILPKAYAIAFVPVAKAIYVVGAVVTLGGCYLVSNFPHDHGRSIGPGCLLIAAGWPVVAAGAVVLGGAYLASSAVNAAEVPTKYECDKDGGITVYGSGSKKVRISKDGDGFRSEPPNKTSDGKAFSAAVTTLRTACKVAPEGISKLNTTVQGNGSTTKESIDPQRATK